MTLPRRTFLRLAAGAPALPAILRSARAQTYPSRPIRVIVPYIPGSPVDAAARVIVQQLQSRLGQSILVENRPGAGTTIGTKAVAGAAPDGYTVLFNGDSMGYYPVLYPDLNFDPSHAHRHGCGVVTRHGYHPDGTGEHGRRVGGLCESQSR